MTGAMNRSASSGAPIRLITCHGSRVMLPAPPAGCGPEYVLRAARTSELVIGMVVPPVGYGSYCCNAANPPTTVVMHRGGGRTSRGIAANLSQVAGTFRGWKGDFKGFFLGLRANNNKPYFEAHRKQYEEDVKAPMVALLADLEPEFGPARRISRPHRDIRFSADKSPYKLNIYADLEPAGMWRWTRMASSRQAEGTWSTTRS